MLGQLSEFDLLPTFWKVRCGYCHLDGTGILYVLAVQLFGTVERAMGLKMTV
jgi:hypothetical protein